MDCKKVRSSVSKYRVREGPPYPANKCKTMKKRGNDGLMYKSIGNKNGVYRWVKWEKPSAKTRKLKNKSITLEDLKKMADKYYVTRSGTKKEIAQRILGIRAQGITKTDFNKIQPLISVSL